MIFQQNKLRSLQQTETKLFILKQYQSRLGTVPQFSWACSGAQNVGNQSTEELGDVVTLTESLLGAQHCAMPSTTFPLSSPQSAR